MSKFDRNEGNFTDDLEPEAKAMMYKELEKFKGEDPNFDPDLFLKQVEEHPNMKVLLDDMKQPRSKNKSPVQSDIDSQVTQEELFKRQHEKEHFAHLSPWNNEK